MEHKEDRFPLYKVFGKFMGQEVTIQPGVKLENSILGQIRHTADEHGLKARFTSKSKISKDLDVDTERLTVFINDNTKKIDEITIG